MLTLGTRGFFSFSALSVADMLWGRSQADIFDQRAKPRAAKLREKKTFVQVANVKTCPELIVYLMVFIFTYVHFNIFTIYISNLYVNAVTST